MPVTLAIPFRDAKRPPPLPVANDAAASTPPPLPSMRVPKPIVVHDANGDQIDVQAAVLKARRATEELEWQAQVKRAKETLIDPDEAEWAALRARTKTLPLSTPPKPRQPRKPALKLAPAPVSLTPAPAVQPAPAPIVSADENAAEEREWQELRARARLAEEREWEELIARARLSSAPPVYPFEAEAVQSARPMHKASARVVAWP